MNLTQLNAYDLVTQQDLPDIKSNGTILRHKKTGARICLMENTDDNKVFYIGFRTPSGDSTGVAHIIEHSVLCGSKNFPAKDPFIELAKGSLNTFLNAMTYPDKTMYPVASCNLADFKNLMNVYLDAVFYPNIYQREEIFKQEGWHYELASPQDTLTINGVVYNEMKGAFSSPESVLDRLILNSLYPDTSYQYESGGDPSDIPKLTYENFLNFHKTYYHPTNSYIYLYGDLDMEERLAWLDTEYLSKFEQISVNSAILTQAPFTSPVTLEKFYSLANSESKQENTYLSANFSVGSALDETLSVAFEVLDYALLGAPGAPLKKALLDAKIGKDIMSSYDDDSLQPIFSIVAKYSDENKKEAFLNIIKSVLEEQKNKGINKKSLAAALNSFEFRFREADFGNFPKGLFYGISCLSSWLYDETAPFLHLNTLKVIDYLKKQVETNYFEELIDRYFLNNSHLSIVLVKPKKGLGAEQDKELEEQLKAYQDSLSEEEIKQLVADTKSLKIYQEEPSKKEDLLKIPLLTRGDLKKVARPLSIEEKGDGIVYHKVDSNGVIYLNLLFSTKHLPKEDIPYLGILKAVLGYVDTKKHSYLELANEVNLHTGGVWNNISTYSLVEKEGYESYFTIGAKALYEKTEKAFELMGEIISESKFDDEGRLYEIIARQKSGLQMTFSSAGHSISAIRAMSYFSESAKYSDLTGGIDSYRLINQIESDFSAHKDDLIAKLKSLLPKIFTKKNLLGSVGSEETGFQTFTRHYPAFLTKLYADSKETAKEQTALSVSKENEGFMGASQVQYVARAGNFKKEGYAYTGTLCILKAILSYDYLWQNVRVLGGAYGAMTGFSRNGDGYFCSYRDPNLKATNQVYEGVLDYLKAFDPEERDMTKYVIGTMSDLDRPLNPAAIARRSLGAYVSGLRLEDFQKEWDEVLSATKEDIHALIPLIAAILKENALCVIGNEEKLREDADLFGRLENLYD
ncbi:peptidase [Clostridia bacterium]|nr:peptidase [Clostridia bacterium]